MKRRLDGRVAISTSSDGTITGISVHIDHGAGLVLTASDSWDMRRELQRTRKRDTIRRLVLTALHGTGEDLEQIYEVGGHLDVHVTTEPDEALPPHLHADQLVNGDRHAAYGNPADNLARIAATWTALLGPRLTTALTAPDIALLMAALKLARQAGHHRVDNLTDAHGYLILLHDLTGKDTP